MPQKRSSSKIKPKTPSASNQIVLLSACLTGIKSRYDGHHKLRKGLLRKLGKCPILPVCPEQLGGLSTPRSRAQIIGGNGSEVLKGKARVVNAQGQDVTAQFIKGAKETLKIVRLNNIKKVIFKEGSPSCGTKRCIRREKQSGPGVTTAILQKEGIEVVGIE